MVNTKNLSILTSQTVCQQRQLQPICRWIGDSHWQHMSPTAQVEGHILHALKTVHLSVVRVCPTDMPVHFMTWTVSAREWHSTQISRTRLILSKDVTSNRKWVRWEAMPRQTRQRQMIQHRSLSNCAPGLKHPTRHVTTRVMANEAAALSTLGGGNDGPIREITHPDWCTTLSNTL